MVGATIAMRGLRPIPTLVYGAKPRFVRARAPASLERCSR